MVLVKLKAHQSFNPKSASSCVIVYTLSFIILDIVGGKPSSFVSKCSLPPTTFLSLSYGDYVTLPEAQLQKYVTCYNFFSKLSQHKCSLTTQNLPVIYLKPPTARTSSTCVI